MIRIIQLQPLFLCCCSQTDFMGLNAIKWKRFEPNYKHWIEIHPLLFIFSRTAWLFHNSCRLIIERKRSLQTMGFISQTLSNWARLIWELAGRHLPSSSVLWHLILVLLSNRSILEIDSLFLFAISFHWIKQNRLVQRSLIPKNLTLLSLHHTGISLYLSGLHWETVDLMQPIWWSIWILVVFCLLVRKSDHDSLQKNVITFKNLC